MQTFVPPAQVGSTYNLALIGQAVSEEKMFENVNGRTTIAIETRVLDRPGPKPNKPFPHQNVATDKI